MSVWHLININLERGIFYIQEIKPLLFLATQTVSIFEIMTVIEIIKLLVKLGLKVN